MREFLKVDVSIEFTTQLVSSIRSKFINLDPFALFLNCGVFMEIATAKAEATTRTGLPHIHKQTNP